jgi:hypothetical protein
MSVSYHVYSNDGLGGPVDYTSIVATTALLVHPVGPLDYGSDWTFAVRAYDTVSALEERNADARVRILVSAAGADLAGLPNAPSGLGVRATAGGGATVRWTYNPRGQGAPPTGFRVYVGTPTPSFGSPAATVPYAAGASTFSASLSGLSDGTDYQAAVRSYNASGEESNTSAASFTAASVGPAPVSGLTASLVP